MAKLWALSGKMGSGKSTVARVIVADGGNVVSLATALKKMVARHIGIAPETPYCLTNDFKQLAAAWPGPLTEDELPRPVRSLTSINRAISSKAATLKTVGALLQIVGEAFRQEDHMYWVRALQCSAEWYTAMESGKDTVIDDVRYLNELVWYSEFMGATVLRIVAGNDTDALRAVAGRSTTHESELGLDAYEFAITIVTDVKESEQSLMNRVKQVVALIKA